MFHPDSATDGHFNLSLAESLRNNRTDLSGQIASSVLPGVPGSSWDCLDPWANVVITNNTRVRRAATDLSLSTCPEPVTLTVTQSPCFTYRFVFLPRCRLARSRPHRDLHDWYYPDYRHCCSACHCLPDYHLTRVTPIA